MILNNLFLGFQIGIPHLNLAEGTMRPVGRIPKGTQTIQFLYPSNNDPRFFPDPRKFDPDRFYNSKEDAFQAPPSERSTMFGVGKRKCLGEVLARAEIFLCMGRLVQAFKMECDPRDVGKLEEEEVAGVPSTPRPFRFRIVEMF